MTLRELLKKPYWTPTELSRAVGISVATAREKIGLIRKELESQGFINLSCSKVPTKVLIDRLNIDLEFLEKNGALDVDLGKERQEELWR